MSVSRRKATVPSLGKSELKTRAQQMNARAPGALTAQELIGAPGIVRYLNLEQLDNLPSDFLKQLTPRERRQLVVHRLSKRLKLIREYHAILFRLSREMAKVKAVKGADGKTTRQLIVNTSRNKVAGNPEVFTPKRLKEENDKLNKYINQTARLLKQSFEAASSRAGRPGFQALSVVRPEFINFLNANDDGGANGLGPVMYVDYSNQTGLKKDEKDNLVKDRQTLDIIQGRVNPVLREGEVAVPAADLATYRGIQLNSTSLVQSQVLLRSRGITSIGSLSPLFWLYAHKFLSRRKEVPPTDSSKIKYTRYVNTSDLYADTRAGKALRAFITDEAITRFLQTKGKTVGNGPNQINLQDFSARQASSILQAFILQKYPKPEVSREATDVARAEALRPYKELQARVNLEGAIASMTHRAFVHSPGRPPLGWLDYIQELKTATENSKKAYQATQQRRT